MLSSPLMSSDRTGASRDIEILVEKKEAQEDELQDLSELLEGLEYECSPLPMLSSDKTGASRDIEPGLVRSIKETQQPEKLVDIRERIGSWRYSIKFNQVTEEKFEEDHEIGVYTHPRNQLFVDGLSNNSSGGERSDTVKLI